MIEAAELYRKMILIRECEERIRKEYSSNDLKTPTHLGIGSEAIAVGVTSVLPADTKYFGTYRNHALYLALGGDLDKFWGELYGKETGTGKGKAGSMHLSAPEAGLLVTSAVVGTTIPTAVGSALALQYRRENNVTCSFFGDGATEEGVFHESINFAQLHRLKILFVCEDNTLAIHNPIHRRQSFNLQKLIESFGMPYRLACGQSLDEVLEETEKAVKAIEDGPAFLHCRYHRFLEHVGPNEDYNAGYRHRPVYEYRVDPIKVLETEKCVRTVSPASRLQITAQVMNDIERSVYRAKEAAFPADYELTTDVFEES